MQTHTGILRTWDVGLIIKPEPCKFSRLLELVKDMRKKKRNSVTPL